MGCSFKRQKRYYKNTPPPPPPPHQTQVNITKCLRKAFLMEHLRRLLLRIVEGFLRISKGGFTRIDLYDSTNLNV